MSLDTRTSNNQEITVMLENQSIEEANKLLNNLRYTLQQESDEVITKDLTNRIRTVQTYIIEKIKGDTVYILYSKNTKCAYIPHDYALLMSCDYSAIKLAAAKTEETYIKECTEEEFAYEMIMAYKNGFKKFACYLKNEMVFITDIEEFTGINKDKYPNQIFNRALQRSILVLHQNIKQLDDVQRTNRMAEIYRHLESASLILIKEGNKYLCSNDKEKSFLYAYTDSLAVQNIELSATSKAVFAKVSSLKQINENNGTCGIVINSGENSISVTTEMLVDVTSKAEYLENKNQIKTTKKTLKLSSGIEDQASEQRVHEKSVEIKPLENKTDNTYIPTGEESIKTKEKDKEKKTQFSNSVTDTLIGNQNTSFRSDILSHADLIVNVGLELQNSAQLMSISFNNDEITENTQRMRLGYAVESAAVRNDGIIFIGVSEKPITLRRETLIPLLENLEVKNILMRAKDGLITLEKAVELVSDKRFYVYTGDKTNLFLTKKSTIHYLQSKGVKKTDITVEKRDYISLTEKPIKNIRIEPGKPYEMLIKVK